MPTLFVATIGGHLAELVQIAGRLPDDADDVRVWATQEHPQSRSILAGEKVVYVPEVSERDVRGVARNLPFAHRLHREWRFTRVVSTGSGTALGFLPYLAARGVSAHYVECATRVESPSLTGNLLGAVPGVHRYTQWKHMAHGRWHYGGSVFDGFDGATKAKPGPIKRAVVTVGTMPDFAFRSLFDAVAPLLRPGGAIELAQGCPVDTLWQTGCTPVDGLGIEARPFVPGAELEAAISAADLVVSHAGTGSSVTALTAGRFPVLVPRRSAAGEIGDDHQELFARELDRRDIAMRRAPSELTAADLMLASTRYVTRSTQPEPFQLLG
jgi:UDP-N-acetylglucosamine--N-acetylmuramyl-(pentapeptide) pyrophosphoryl-undecaprenol N-acetylglucosamine transferase